MIKDCSNSCCSNSCCVESESKYDNSEVPKKAREIIALIDKGYGQPEAELDYFNESLHKIEKADQEKLDFVTPPWLEAQPDAEDIKLKMLQENWNAAAESAKEIQAAKIDGKYPEMKMPLNINSVPVKQFADLKILDNSVVENKSSIDILNVSLYLIVAFSLFYILMMILNVLGKI